MRCCIKLRLRWLCQFQESILDFADLPAVSFQRVKLSTNWMKGQMKLEQCVMFCSCPCWQLPCVRPAMLPGYGFSPFPDFQPHLHIFHYRGESPSMWIPGSGEAQTLSEAQENRPLLHTCHHKHVAVCQQETLAFIELQPPVTLNILDTQSTAHSLQMNGFKHTLKELDDMQNSCHRTDGEHQAVLSLNCHQTPAADAELQHLNGFSTSVQEPTERPRTVTTVCRPLHAALSLPLSFPLSSLYTNTDAWDPQVPGSPSSPEDPGFQGPDSCQPQRRTSQGSLKEKSISECAVSGPMGRVHVWLCFILGIITMFVASF